MVICKPNKTSLKPCAFKTALGITLGPVYKKLGCSEKIPLHQNHYHQSKKFSDNEHLQIVSCKRDLVYVVYSI